MFSHVLLTSIFLQYTATLFRFLAPSPPWLCIQPNLSKPNQQYMHETGLDIICIQISISDHRGGMGVWSHETRTFKLIQHSCYQFLTLKIFCICSRSNPGIISLTLHAVHKLYLIPIITMMHFYSGNSRGHTHHDERKGEDMKHFLSRAILMYDYPLRSAEVGSACGTIVLDRVLCKH